MDGRTHQGRHERQDRAAATDAVPHTRRGALRLPHEDRGAPTSYEEEDIRRWEEEETEQAPRQLKRADCCSGAELFGEEDDDYTSDSPGAEGAVRFPPVRLPRKVLQYGQRRRRSAAAVEVAPRPRTFGCSASA